MAEQNGGLSSADFRAQAAVNGLRRQPGVPSAADPLDQILADARKASAIKLMNQQDKSMEVELLKADNQRLEAEITHQKLLEERGGPTGTTNPHLDFLYRQLENVQGRLDQAQQHAQVAQAAVLEDRMKMLQDELARVKATPVEVRDELESSITTLEKALALADRVRPAPTLVDRGPDPGLERFLATLEADREARRFEAEERRRNQEIDLQLKREALAREEARLDKQAASQERFLTDTVPKLLQLGQQLMETLTARLGQGSQAPVPVVAGAVRADAAPSVGEVYAAPVPSRPSAPLPAGASQMTCQVCQAQIIYREGAPEVFCSTCGSVYSSGPLPDDGPAPGESDELTPDIRGYDTDPAIPS